MKNLNKRLPVDICSFEQMICDNYIYVDKTDLIGSLVLQKGPFLYTRPKGFGKSTLLSTMQSLFSKGKELFTGLKISHNFPLQQNYAVLLLDFASFKGSGSDIKGQRAFYIDKIKDFFKEQGVDLLDNYLSLASVLDAGLSSIKNQIVLLIDNYDAPLSQALCNKELFESQRTALSNFYAVIKSHSAKFKFIFITGSVRFTDSTVFASFNNLQDISFTRELSSLTGFTQNELESYFKDRIQSYVARQSADGGAYSVTYSYKELLENLYSHYGRYCFDLLCELELYSPIMLIDFLQSEERGMPKFSTDARSLIPSYLSEFVRENKHLLLDDSAASIFNSESFIKSADFLKLDVKGCDNISDVLFSLVFAAGFLSIKSAQLDALELVACNFEAKRALKSLQSLLFKDNYDTQLS